MSRAEGKKALSCVEGALESTLFKVCVRLVLWQRHTAEVAEAGVALRAGHFVASFDFLRAKTKRGICSEEFSEVYSTMMGTKQKEEYICIPQWDSCTVDKVFRGCE